MLCKVISTYVWGRRRNFIVWIFPSWKAALQICKQLIHLNTRKNLQEARRTFYINSSLISLWLFPDWKDEANQAVLWCNRHGGSHWLRHGCGSRGRGWSYCDDKTFNWQQKGVNRFLKKEKKFSFFRQVVQTHVCGIRRIKIQYLWSSLTIKNITILYGNKERTLYVSFFGINHWNIFCCFHGVRVNNFDRIRAILYLVCFIKF